MIEKRKKLAIHVEDGEPFHVDVEAYDNKKSSFRNKWVYFAILAVILIIAYLQYQSSHSHTAVRTKPAGFVEPTKANNSNVPKAKPTYTVKTAALPQQPAVTAQTVGKSSSMSDSAALVSQLHNKEADAKAAVAKNNLRTESTATAVVASTDNINEAELQVQVDAQIAKVRKMRYEDHIVMEQNADAKREVGILQDLIRKLLLKQYGPGPIRVEMKLQFPQSMSQPVLPQEQTVVIDMAPITLVPYSVYYFLEIVKHWKSGAFSRNAGHVLQATANTDVKGRGMAFQEYHPDFPHKQYTMGYAGRPGGPAFYISTVNNVQNHGPASQGSKSEADGCFGKVQAQSIEVVKRMQTQPGAAKPMGFVNDPKNFIRIVSMKILTH